MVGYMFNKFVDIDFNVCNYLYSDRNMLGIIVSKL